MHRPCFALFLGALLSIAGCEGRLYEQGVDAGGADAAFDTGMGDAGGPDSSRLDADARDTGAGDTGASDTGAGDTGVVDTGAVDPCAGVACGAGETCAPSRGGCVCAPGFVRMGGRCEAPAPGDPAGRAADEVCAIWRAGHEENAGRGWTAGASMCDLGTLDPETIADTLRRVGMYRELVGLGPVVDIPSQQQVEQECAVMMNAAGRLDHTPPMSFPCYTAAGAGAAGRSNLALGARTPAAAIDLYVGDERVASLGHRRWVLNFPLGRVGIGYAGSAQCLSVFDRSGSASRSWTAWPNPGPTPRTSIPSVWSYLTTGSVAGGSVRVTRVSDGMDLPVDTYVPASGFGANALAFTPMGWSATSGETYRVEITGLRSGPVSYEVSPVDC